MSPFSSALTISEDQLQAACTQWLWNTYPQTRRCLFHIPNGGSRNAREAVKLRAMGVVAGVHDLCFIWASRVYFFELKVGKNIQSKEQLAFGLAVRNQGAICNEIRCLEEFKEYIEHVLNIKPKI